MIIRRLIVAAIAAGLLITSSSSAIAVPVPVGPIANSPTTASAGASSRDGDLAAEAKMRAEFAAQRSRHAAVQDAAYSAAEQREYTQAVERALEAAEDERAAREELQERQTHSVTVRSKAKPIIERADVVRARYIRAAAAFVRDVPGLSVDERAQIDAIVALPERRWPTELDQALAEQPSSTASALGYLKARAAWVEAREARDAALERTTDRADMVTASKRALAKSTKQREAAEGTLLTLVTRLAPQQRVDDNGCPLVTVPGVLPKGVDLGTLCQQAVAQAATPQAADAIRWALSHLGAPYACDGTTRMQPLHYDCSSFVSRAYAEGAGVELLVDGWAPTTHTMAPWGGGLRHPAFRPIRTSTLAPGDLVLYRTCEGPDCLTQHVAMYLGNVGGRDLMAHANLCGGVSRVTAFWGTGADHAFMGARRVAG